jgi:hypothetical protein
VYRYHMATEPATIDPSAREATAFGFGPFFDA